MLAFCVLANVYIVQICILDGALSMFSKRGYVPDIRPLGEGVYQEILSLGGVFPNTPPREQECHVIQYHPCCQ